MSQGTERESLNSLRRHLNPPRKGVLTPGMIADAFDDSDALEPVIEEDPAKDYSGQAGEGHSGVRAYKF